MHPLAWWAWALGLAAAVVRTPDPRVQLAVPAVVVLVVLARRADTPWGRAFGGYLLLALLVVVVRLAFHVVVGIKPPGTVLLDLPRVPVPDWAVGVDLLGPVTVEGLRAAALGGLRLAGLVLCFGAANALADPRRALRSLPASLHQVGTAVVIAVSVAPQLVASAAAVRRAQRLRGQGERGLRAVRSTVVPVLTDALDRSLALAASMDVRGYARTLPGGSPRAVTGLLVTALLAASLGVYGLLDATAPTWLGAPLLVVGAAAAVAGTVLAGRRVRRTRYRPDPWRTRETLTCLGGATAAALVVVAARPGLGSPGVEAWSAAAILAAASPLLLAPSPRAERPSAVRPAPARVVA